MTHAIRMLGSVELDGGKQVFGAKPRALLVTLLLQANRTVTVDRLLRSMWDGAAPRSAVANLRTYAHGLRRSLFHVNAKLDNRPGGYLLQISPEICDHLSFDQLVARGRSAMANGTPSTGVAVLEQALGLWRGGTAAEGVARYGPLANWLDDLDEERMRTIENLAEARIGVGDARTAVRELSSLLALAPLRGRAWSLRMLAHHRLGENDAVAATYREATRVFREELGLDPDPELTRLYTTMLGWQTSSSERLRVNLGTPASPVLVGRDKVLNAVRDTAIARIDAPRPGVVVVHGPVGVGTSALVRLAAQDLASSFPHGQLYLNLSEYPGAAGALRDLLTMVGVDSAQTRSGNAVSRLRGATAQHRLLVVLDNATSAAQVLPLLSLGDHCCVLVASHSPLGTVDAARFAIGPLTTEDSITMLSNLIGQSRADPAQTRRIARSCDRLPLALRIAAACLIDRPNLAITTLADKLANDRRALAELAADGLNLKSRLLLALSSAGGSAAAVLPHLAASGKVAPASVAPRLGWPVERAEAAFADLIRAGLVEPAGHGGYRLPRFTRLLASELPTEAVSA